MSLAFAPQRQALTVGLTAVGAAIPLVVSLLERFLAPGNQWFVTSLGLCAMWIFAAAVYVLLRPQAGRPRRSRLRLGWTDLLIALCVGVAAALLVPVLSLVATRVIGETDLVATTSQVGVPMLVASIITAAVTEEVLYRAAPIELLDRRRVPPWLIFVLPWAVFVLAHLGSWNLAHVIGVVMPLGALLTWLYLWRRNLLVNITAHAIVDAPLIVIALNSAAVT